jgi:hypothetical protein
VPEIETYIGHKIPVGQIPDGCIQALKPPVKIKRHARRGGRRRSGGKPSGKKSGPGRKRRARNG